MASLRLDVVWLNPLDDRAHGMAFKANAIEHDPTVNVTTRQYAGGNYAAVITPGMQRVAKVSMNFLTDVQVRQLKAWYAAAVPLIYRDPTGEKFCGVLAGGLTFTPRPIGNSWSVPLQIAEISYSEAV